MTTLQPAWCKTDCKAKNQYGHKCDGGSFGTYSKRAFALAVSVALNGRATCAVCDVVPVSLHDGDVDRTVAGCYRIGYIAMTCRRCNNERTHMPRFNVDRYVGAVLGASEGIRVLGPTEAKARWNDDKPVIGETVEMSRYYE